MTNLRGYGEAGSELVIDDKTGETFLTVGAAAWLCGKPKSEISKSVSDVTFFIPMTLKNAQIKTSVGVRPAMLLNEKQILELTHVLNKPLKERLRSQGIRVYLHQLVGFELTP
jgi:hypothetical protein